MTNKRGRPRQSFGQNPDKYAIALMVALDSIFKKNRKITLTHCAKLAIAALSGKGPANIEIFSDRITLVPDRLSSMLDSKANRFVQLCNETGQYKTRKYSIALTRSDVDWLKASQEIIIMALSPKIRTQAMLIPQHVMIASIPILLSDLNWPEEQISKLKLFLELFANLRLASEIVNFEENF